MNVVIFGKGFGQTRQISLSGPVAGLVASVVAVVVMGAGFAGGYWFSSMNGSGVSSSELESLTRQVADQKETIDAIRQGNEDTLDALDTGALRVAEKQDDGSWHVNQWAKKAVLLGFRIKEMEFQSGGPQGSGWWDKVDSKFAGWGDNQWKAAGFRAVPNCVVRRSAFIAPGVVLMPSFVNLGAYVDEGTMVDTWATVGSCAQIGKNVHLSGGAGIGGVLEPLQANPTIIEDNCFIGARSEIVEGVVVETGAVISMGVFIGQSTRIYDRERDEVIYGRVPAGGEPLGSCSSRISSSLGSTSRHARNARSGSMRTRVLDQGPI